MTNDEVFDDFLRQHSAARERMNNDEVCKRSGSIKDSRRLVAFFYLLLRNHLPSGTVERIMKEIEMNEGAERHYSNGWTAQHAQNLADRLTTEPEE